MSFQSERIEQYLLSRASKDQPRTTVPFAKARIGNLEIVIVSEDRQQMEDRVSEEEIEQHLAKEGLIRLPPRDHKPIEEFKRIDVGGKPMSEVIIEERR